jgi:glycerol-1-phosphate dehydrogenase [NAD(P)+]
MTRSGLGDQLSMFTACADWYLSSLVGFDRTFSATTWQVLRAGSAPVLGSGARLAAGDHDAVLGLAMALTRGGLAMGIAGRTSPSSGTEHMISHLLDMRAHAEQRPGGRHGAQVGVGSVVAASIWETMRSRLGSGGQVVAPLPVDVMRQRIEDAFLVLDPSGTVAKECWSAYERKLTWINAHLPKLQAICDGWAGCDPTVGELLAAPTTLATTLRRAGAAARFADLDPAPSEATARWALANGHLMRDRFTIVDLAEVTGNWSADDVDRVWAATQGER